MFGQTSMTDPSVLLLDSGNGNVVRALTFTLSGSFARGKFSLIFPGPPAMYHPSPDFLRTYTIPYTTLYWKKPAPFSPVGISRHPVSFGWAAAVAFWRASVAFVLASATSALDPYAAATSAFVG